MDFSKLVPASNCLANYLDLNADVVVTSGVRRGVGLMMKRAYDRGFVGCFADTEDSPNWARRIAKYESDRFRDECNGSPSLMEQIGRTLYDGEGKRSAPLALAQQFDKRCLTGAQAFGNCTACSCGWDIMNMLNAIEVAVKGESQAFGDPFATALIYGLRGHGGQGMALSTAASGARDYGVSRRTNYDGYDCRSEDRDESYGNQWGRSGPPKAFSDQVTGRVVKVGTLDHVNKAELRDLLYSGVMIHHGGTLTGTRTGSPLVSLTGVGPHAQSTLGMDDTDEARKHCGLADDEFVVFNQQTWGPYFNISRWREDLWGPQVEGTWPVKASDALRVVNQDSYGYVAYDGPKPPPLDWDVIIP